MARTFWQKVKDFFTGGSSSSGRTSSSSSGSSYYGGGYRSARSSSGSSSGSSRSGGRTYRSDRDEIEEEKKRLRESLKKKQEDTTKSLEQISKRTDALSAGVKQVPSTTAKGSGRAMAVAKISQKEKSQTQKNLEILKAQQQKKNEEWHAATNHRFDVNEKGISAEERLRRQQNVKSQIYDPATALDEAKWEMKHNKGIESFERGVLDVATLGVSDLAAKRLTSGAAREAEEYYQANKSKGWETAGRFVGALIPYGGTAGAFERLGTRAVGRAAETAVGKRLGAEALARTMAGTGAKSALARSLVGDAIQDSTIGLVDTMTDIAGRDDLETAGDYAKAVAEEQALNYLYGLGGNLLFNGLPVAREAVGNFVDESRRLYAVPKEFAGTGESIKRTVGRESAGIDLSKALTEEERNILRARQREILAQANNLEAKAMTAEPVDKNNLLMYVEDLRAESGAIEMALGRGVGVPAKIVDAEAVEAERAAKRAKEIEELKKQAEQAEEPVVEQPMTPEEKQKAEIKKKANAKKKKAESAENKRFAKEYEEYSAKLSEQKNSPDGTVAKGKNLWTGEKLEFWKKDGELYVGNPNGKSQSFGKDIPENRRKAEDEFDFLNHTRKQKFAEARKKAEKAEAKAKAVNEKPQRPANVRHFPDKELKAMEKGEDFSKLTKAEYEWYFPDRKIELDFGGDEGSVSAGVKSKEAQDKLDELILEGKETKTLTKKQVEAKVNKSNKRLAELEEQIKKSANSPRWVQDRLSGKYEGELTFNKRMRELLEKANGSEDGKVTVTKGKSNYVKKTIEEPEVTVTKSAIEPQGKKKGGKRKGKKAEEPKAEVETRAEEPKAEVETRAEEPKAEAPKETRPKKTKAEKEIEKLQNKVDFAETKVKNTEKELKKRRKEGASEGSIKYWEDSLAEAKANRKELKAELRKAKKELGVETKPQDNALKEGGKEPPKPAKEEAAELPVFDDNSPTAKTIKSLENKIANSENQIRRLDEALEKKRAEGATEKSIAWTENARAKEIAKKEDFEAELEEAKKALNVEAKAESPKEEPQAKGEVLKEDNKKPSKKESAKADKSQTKAEEPIKTEVKEEAPDNAKEIAGVEKKLKSLDNKIDNAEKNVRKYDSEIKKKERDGASEKSIEWSREQRAKAAQSRSDLKAERRRLNKELKALQTGAEPKTKALKDGGAEPPKSKSNGNKAKTETEIKSNVKVDDDGLGYVDESPFDVGAKSQTPKGAKGKNAASKGNVKGVKEAGKKLKEQKNKFRRNAPPRGEWVHRNVYKESTGKELDEALNPPTFKDYLDAKKTYTKGQASGEKEVVSRAGTSLMNATTDDAQREFLRKGWQDGDFTYTKIKNKEKYAEVMKHWVDEPEAVARDLIRYNDDLSTLSVDKMVDTHYQAHCVMKMLRSELDNPALSEAEREATREIYSAAASLSQKLASRSGQVEQFQGVMVHCSPAKRSDNALDNIASILDSSRGYRKKTRVSVDGVEMKLSDNKATRMQQIKNLLLENDDVKKNLEKVYNAKTEEEYGEAMSELLLSTYKLNHATGLDYIQQWRYLAMLGNPKTHLRNIVGNITFGTLRNISNTVRSLEEKALGGYAAKHNLEIDYHGGLSPKAWRQARFKNAADDDASKAAWEFFEKHEKQILGSTKYESPQLGAGYLSKGNTKLLGWEDDLFRAPAYREQFIKSYNKFAKKGKITDDILDRIHREALKESQIATFNEFNELAQILASSQRGLYDANASLGKKAVGFASNALLPFTKVPANILKQSVNYTPVGAVKGVAHILDAAKSGDSALFNKALDELASGITGTGIAALGYFLGKHTDIFTTNAGSEDAAAKFKKQQGVQNYSATVNLKNGKSYSFTLDWLVPASCTFFTGVEVANQLKNGIGGANIFEAGANLSQVMSRVIDPVLETSMLSSIYNIVENSRKSSSYDDQQSFLNIAGRELAQSYVSSFVPTLLGQVARSFIYDADKMVTGEGDWEYFWNSLKVKAGLADTDILGDRLGDDTNAYGEVKNKKEDFGDKAWSFVKNGILPTNIQEVNLTETDKEKIKEYEEYVANGGDPADKEYLFPKKQYRKNFTVGKKGADPMDVKLTNEQVSLYNQAKTTGGGEGMRVALEGIMFNRYDKDSSGKRTILKNGYTAEEKEQLIKQFEGKSIREVEQWLYKQPQFRSATEEERRKVLNALWSYSQSGKSQGSKRVGEQAVIEAQGKDINEYNFKNELSKAKQNALMPYVENGILTYEECVDFARNAGKTYYYENDEGGSSSTYYNKKQMIEYLQSKGYSYEKAEALYNSFKASNAKGYNGSSSSGGKGYGRRRRSGGGSGGSGSTKATSIPKPKKITGLKAGEALVTKKGSSSSKRSQPQTLKRVEAKIDLPTVKRTTKR